MLRILIVPLALLAPLLCGCAASHSDARAGGTTTTPGGPQITYSMPAVSIPARARAGASQYGFRLADNRRMSLSDYRGQVIVLDFFATWCIPCREETPHLVEMQKRYGKQGLHVIGMNVGGPDDRNHVAEFARQFGIPPEYTLGFPDPEMSALYLTGDDSIPQAFVFDRKGGLVKRFISYDDRMPAELERIARSALEAPAD